MTALATAIPARSAAISYDSLTPPAISWVDCSSTYGPGFTCANYSVPVDWSVPSGEQISLGMNRYRAKSSTTNERQNLLVNYGGPGGIATQTLPPTVPYFDDEITNHFDLSKS